MASLFTEKSELLEQLWKQFNPTEEEYLEGEPLKEWIKAAYEQNNLLSNYEESMTDTDGLIRQYLLEVQ